VAEDEEAKKGEEHHGEKMMGQDIPNNLHRAKIEKHAGREKEQHRPHSEPHSANDKHSLPFPGTKVEKAVLKGKDSGTNEKIELLHP
jgi:hypothetical protein